MTFQSYIYATEKTEKSDYTTITDREEDIVAEQELEQVVINIRNKLFILLLDEETMDYLDLLVDAEAVYSCERDTNSRQGSSDPENSRNSDGNESDSREMPNPPEPFEFEEDEDMTTMMTAPTDILSEEQAGGA